MPPKTAAPQRGLNAANRVRIIGGVFRRQLLEFPDRAGLRPTPDRVRETLFNWLGQDLPGWRCLDLFAGSGALGFEAASRGAAQVTLVECDSAALAALEKNRVALAARTVSVQRGDARHWLAADHTPWDLIFLDPPFDSGLAEVMLPDLRAHLAPGGQVYVEQGCAVEAPAGFIMRKSGRAGRSHFALLEKEDAVC